MSKMTLFQRFRLGLGKLRRTYLHTFHRDYIRRQLARRKGQCARCGACCKLMFKCPYLDESSEQSACNRHHMRWWNCRIFPVDERDIRDRDTVNGHGKCGYYFDPPMPPQRWLAILLAVSVAASASVSDASAAAAPKSDRPVVAQTSFRGQRLPRGWWVEDGSWECARGGLLCNAPGRISGALQKDAIPVREVDARIEVWGEFAPIEAKAKAGAVPNSGSASGVSEGAGAPGPRSPSVYVAWGTLKAGLQTRSLGSVFGSFGDMPVAELTDPGSSGGVKRFHLTVVFDGTVAIVSSSRGQQTMARDILGVTLDRTVTRLTVGAARGTVVHAVRVKMTPRTGPRDARLADADAAFASGDRAAAINGYAMIEGDRTALPVLRSEALYKRGVLLWNGEQKREALRDWDMARDLDGGGPWGERAYLALARAALEDERPAAALRLAGDMVRGRAPRVEEWQLLRGLLRDATKGMQRAGVGSQASFGLERIAERLEWSEAPTRHTAWVWDLVAEAYEHRGYAEQAAVARKTARRLAE